MADPGRTRHPGGITGSRRPAGITCRPPGRGEGRSTTIWAGCCSPARAGPRRLRPAARREDRLPKAFTFGHARAPDLDRVKGPDNYVGRIVAAVFSFGIYMFWWYYNQMQVPNQHFAGNRAQEDELARAVEAIS